MLDYDAIDEWAPRLERALDAAVPLKARSAVATSHPEFIEDALATLLLHANQETVAKCMLTWIRGQQVAAYHGSRLNPAEAQSIRTSGLTPLLPEQRKVRLERALSRHPLWGTKACLLDDAIRTHSGAGKSGQREGQVHLTLSRAGLTGGFNHYLTHGSEFDQHVAHELLGQTGVDLLAADGTPSVVTVSVPGNSAVLGSHRHITADEMISRGQLPNIVRELLGDWSFKLANQTYQTSRRKLDCGIWFKETVPPEWIASVQEWSVSGLQR